MKWMRVIPILLFVIVAVIFFRGLFTDSKKIPSILIGKPIPHFDLRTLTSSVVFSSDKLTGKPFLLNVFASWCESCQTEHFLLLKIAREKRIAIYGLNYKDTVQTAKQFLDELGNPYQAVFLDETGKVALELGVYATPETFLVDAKGIIRYRWAGPLTQTVWEKEFLPLIKEGESQQRQVT